MHAICRAACTGALATFVFVAASSTAAAQSTPQAQVTGEQPSGDVITLTNGDTLRGTLLEVTPNVRARIQVADGRIATVQWSGIARIDRQPAPAPAPAAPPAPAPDPNRRRQLSYHEGDPVPAGYHVVDKPRTGMVVAGGILAAVAVTIVVAYAASSGHTSDDDLGAVLVTTVFAAPAIPLLIVGLLSLDRKVLVRDDVAGTRWFVAPQAVGTRGVGLAGGLAF
jgi:hypothetical protein